ncbi:hypothetical protein PMAC_000179 [Pneumocystis sp. 'macacae']|nr:hypothetical protein PMAC_000179 [Pneumocystis sp. 'macacae']
MFEEASFSIPCYGNANFDFKFDKNIYENYVNSLLRNKDKKESASVKNLDYAFLDDPSYAFEEELSPIPSNNSSSLDINQGHECKKSSFSIETVSLSDLVLKNTEKAQEKFNVYPDFNSFHQRNNLENTIEVKEDSSLVLDMHEINFPAPYILNIFGIPEKSRVETQVKLEMKLSCSFPSNSSLKSSYSWLKLPRWSIMKEKLKLPNLKDVPKNIDPEKILIIEPSVVCASNIKKNVLICSGCIIREVKVLLNKIYSNIYKA